VRQPDDFSGDPDELITVAAQANEVSDGLFQTVWKDELVGDDWLDHGSGPDDEQLAAAMSAYRQSLRAAASRLADRAERLGDDLRTTADTYSRVDEAAAGRLPRPDQHDE
jgi:hypothetical protein